MSFAVHRLARAGFCAALFSVSIALIGCGGASTPTSGAKNDDTSPPNLPQVSLSGGGVKGPLANAPLAFYEFDAGSPNFQATSPVATGTTDSQASFSGVLVPAPNPPYILVFSTGVNTRDLTTGAPPVITTMKTVVTADMLSQGYPIYATPLTTLAVELAIANANSTQPPYNFTKQPQTVDNFLLALPIAAQQVASSLGFGMSGNVDIFRTWPVVGTNGSAEALRVTAEYRSAVEALSTLAHQMAQSVGGATKADDILKALADDLGDGVIDGTGAVGTISELGTDQLTLLQNANPAALTIPNSTVLVGDVETLLATEAVTIGATADTTPLVNGSIQVDVQSVQLETDTDGDGVLNVADAFPLDAQWDTDTDGDGIADIRYLLDGLGKRTGAFVNEDSDDDNDGLSDAAETSLGTNPLLADTDSDGLMDAAEQSAGTNPLLADSDNDGVLDGVEVAGVGAIVTITSGANAGTYTGIGTNPLDSDSDNDGLTDGAEVEARTNPLSTDSDGDGDLDNVDNCPAVANSNQLDSNGDGVGNACSADLTGVWKLTLQPNSMLWNGCDKSQLGKFYTLYQSVTQMPSGALSVTDHRGMDMTGGIVLATSRFVLTGNDVANLAGGLAARTMEVSARANLDTNGNVTGVTGTYLVLDKIDGTTVCEESGDVAGQFVYKQIGGGAVYNGLYALEYVDHAAPVRGALSAAKTNSGLMQLEITGTLFTTQGHGSNDPVVASGYDPATGVFHESRLHEEVGDLNSDGIDDIHRVTTELTGIMVRAAGDASGATLVFTRNIKDSTYYNLSVYDPDVLPNFDYEQRQEGYGRRISTSAFNETRTQPDADGLPVAVDRIGLSNPTLKTATAASALRFEAYAGAVISGAPLCSVPFESGLVVVENYPAADAANEMLRSGAYGEIACDVGAEGSIVTGGTYTLAIIDDMGTPLDTVGDEVRASILHTAVDTSPAPSVIPQRRNVRMDGAAPSQTQVDARIAIDGYLNPYAEHTLTWPDQGADEYQLRFRDQRSLGSRMANKEFRVASGTNSVTLPAGVMNDVSSTAFEVNARFDDLSGTSAWSVGQTLTLVPFLKGILNVETENSLSGEQLNFQVALQRTDFDADLCTVTYSNHPLTCFSFHLVGALSGNTVFLLFQDPSGQINGGKGFYLSFEFSDAVNATVSFADPLIPYQGAARVVTTELLARSQVQADGTLSTVLTLENPPPLFAAAQLTSQSGTVDLDGQNNMLLTLWDNADPARHFNQVRRGFWEQPVDDAIAPALASEVVFDSAAQSANHMLADGGYRLSLMNHESLAVSDAVFAVDVAGMSTNDVRGPGLAAISVNGIPAGPGAGDSVATAIDASLQTAIDLGWSAMALSTTEWSLVIREVDVTGQPAPDREWRTPFMDTSTLVFTTPGNWSWTGVVNLADYLAAGQTAQVQLVSRDAGGNVQGLSDPVFVHR